MSTLTTARIKWWYFLTFVMGLIEGLVGTFFPLIFVHYGGTLFQLSIVVSLISLVGALQSIWGRLIDRYQKPRLQGGTALVFNSASISIMGASSYPILFGSGRIGNSMSNSAYNTSTAYLRSAYFSNNKRGKVGNLFIGSNLAGVALGVFGAGIYYDYLGYSQSRWLHLFAAVLSLIAFILFFVALPEFDQDLIQDEQLKAAMTEEKANLNYSRTDTLKIMKKSKGLIPFMIATLIFHFAVGLSAPFFIIEMSRVWSLSTLEIGLITTFNAILQVIIIFMFMPVVDIINRKWGYSIGLLFAIIPAVGITLDPAYIISIFQSSLNFWIFIYALSSIGWGLVNALTLTLLIDYVHPKIRATVIGLFGSLQAIIVFIASLLASILIVILGSTLWIFYLSAIGRSLGLIIMVFTKSPPIPSSDFYTQRKIFLTKLTSGVERGIFWIPVVGKILLRKRENS